MASNRQRWSRVLAVDDVTFCVEQNELFTLLGPSGCGKSTALRCIAGLETPDEGEITIGEAERVLFSSERGVNVPPNERGLGMVFQSYAIWPHLNVFQNVAFPLSVLRGSQRLTRKVIRARVERVLAVIGLESLAHRPSTDLSGGQQQRLALGRALVMEPPVLLLDEPLSNLDAKLREVMRLELKRVQEELGITTVYVTHDQVEALAMSNRVAVMRAGQFKQVGRPRDIYEEPASHFVADFIGTSNFLPGTIREVVSPRSYLVETDGGLLQARSSEVLSAGQQVEVGIRPEYIQLSRMGGSEGSGIEEPGRWFGKIVARAFLGEFIEHLIRVESIELRVRTRSDFEFSELSEGTHVRVTVPASSSLVFRRQDDQ